MSWAELAATEPRAAATLEGALAKGKLPHGLLFVCEDPAMARKAANELAKALFCRESSGVTACGVCRDCLRVDKGAHPDVIVLAPSEDTRTIKIEDARRIIAEASLKPFEAPARVFVIESAECLNETAQSALLKTLEEPLGRSIFVLVTASPASLLPTVRSRVQSVRFGGGQGAAVEDADLERWKTEALAFATGSTSSPPEFGKIARPVVAAVLEHLAAVHRDALVVRAGAESLASSGRFVDAKKLAARFDEDALSDRIERISRAKERISQDMIHTKLALAALWDELSGALPAGQAGAGAAQ